MATMRAEVEMRKTRVHTGFHEDAERKRRLRHSERAHSRPNNPETWASATDNAVWKAVEPAERLRRKCDWPSRADAVKDGESSRYSHCRNSAGISRRSM